MRGILDQRSGDDRRDDESPIDIERARMSLMNAAAAITFIVGLLVTYFASVNTVNARVAVLESQQQSSDKTMIRIEQKVDRLLERNRNVDAR